MSFIFSLSLSCSKTFIRIASSVIRFLIFSRLFVFESVASLVIFSTLENFANETQSSESSSSAEKKEFEIEKKNRFYFLFFCLHLHHFVDRKFIRFCFFRFWFKFCDFVWKIVCFSEFEEKRDRSNKRNKVFWWKDCHKKRCFESLWNEQFEFFVIKRFLCRNNQNRRKRREERNFFCFESFVIDFLFDYYQNCQKKSAKKKKKKCRLRRSINIEKIDQFRMKMMRIWFKMFLKKENCRDQRLARKKQRLSRRRLYNSDLRRQSHRYKLCRCYFVD